MSSIRERLLSTEDDFLTAVTLGGAALEAYGIRCQALLDDVDAAIACLDNDTLCLANLVSSRLEIIASSFENMLNAAASAGASMTSELDSMLSLLTLDDGGKSCVPWVTDEVTPIASSESMESVTSNRSFDSPRPQAIPSFGRSATPSLLWDSCSDDSASDSEDETILHISLLGKRCYVGSNTNGDEMSQGYKRHRSSTYSPLGWLWDPEGDDSHRITTNDCEDSIPLGRDGGLNAPRKIKSLPSRTKSVPLTASSPHSPTQTRKRRMSEADADRSAKRSCDAHVGPSRQAVSNPPPFVDNDLEDQSFDVDGWATQFTVVDPATFAPPDTTIPLEFDYTGWSRAPTKTFVAPVAFDFAATAVDPSLEEALEEICFSSIHDIIPPTASDAMKTFECEIAPCLDVATESHPLSRQPDTGALSDAGKTVQVLSLLPAEASEFIPPASTESSLPVSSPSPTPDATTQSDNACAATTLVDDTADCALSVAVKRSRSRSSSSSRTPPPSFESATASLCPDWDPPTYSVFDQFPGTSPETPPPPYCLSPQAKTGPLHRKAFDIGAVANHLSPLAFTGKKRGCIGAFQQHAQAPQAGFAIAV